MFGMFVVEIHPTAVIKNLHLNSSSFFVFKIHKLFSSSNVHVFDSLDLKSSAFNKIGIFQRTLWIKKNLLNEDTYYVSLLLISPPFENPINHLIIDNINSFETIFHKNNNSSKGNFKHKRGGVIAPKLLWTD